MLVGVWCKDNKGGKVKKKKTRRSCVGLKKEREREFFRVF